MVTYLLMRTRRLQYRFGESVNENYLNQRIEIEII